MILAVLERYIPHKIPILLGKRNVHVDLGMLVTEMCRLVTEICMFCSGVVRGEMGMYVC